MSDDIDAHSDTGIGAEARIAAAMHALADSYTPQQHPVGRSSPRSSSGSGHPARPRRWVLGAAAAAVLVAGAAALLAAANREPARVTDRLPDVALTAAAPGVDAPPPDIETFWSDVELADDMVPILVPTPIEPVVGIDVTASSWNWMSGIEDSALVGVLDGDEFVGVLYVLDSVAPWAAISEDNPLIEVDGREAVKLENEAERGLAIRVGDGTRLVIDTSGEAASLIADDDFAALLSLLGEGSLDALVDTDRFVGAPFEGTGVRAVYYGNDNDLSLLQLRLDSGADERSIGLITDIYRRLLDPDVTEVVVVVQVSPVDAIVIGAGSADELASAQRSLQLVPLDESGLQFEAAGGLMGSDLVARGQSSWGRWQVQTTSQDPECRGFRVSTWNIDGSGGGYSDCGEKNPVRADGSWIYCSVVEDAIVGIILDPLAPPDITVDDLVPGLTFEQEKRDAWSAFRITSTEPDADVGAATVLVDGEEIVCF